MEATNTLAENFKQADDDDVQASNANDNIIINDEQNDVDEDERVCHVCGLSEKETSDHDEVDNNNNERLGEMFLCDGNCGTYIHTSCAGLTEPPNGEWFCAACTTNDLVRKIDDPLPSPLRKEHDDFESAAAASLAELSAVRGRFIALRKQRDRLIARWKAERETQRRVELTKRKLRRKREEVSGRSER